MDGETGSLILTEVDGNTIERGTLVFFCRKDESVSSVTFKASNSNFADMEPGDTDLGNGWTAIGSYSNKSITDSEIADSNDPFFFVAQDKFWRADVETTIGCYKSYFICDNPQASAVKTFTITIDGDATPTAIMQVEASSTTANGATTVGSGTIYNLQGQRISQPRHGQINIIGGKKVVIK